MRLLTVARFAFLVAVTALAACSSNASMPTAAGGAAPQSFSGRLPKATGKMIAMTTASHLVPVVHLSHRKSWMKSLAKNTQYLLYVSNQAAGTVDVFAYKSQKGHLVGELTGFQFPYGECQDGSGNVYITDFGATTIVEYAHGGTTPIKTLNDTYGYPIGCAVNPLTGDLAVANYEAAGSGCMGGIVVYAGATGDGTNYVDQDFMYLFPPGYDPNGNLFVQGLPTSGSAGLAELQSGSTALVTVPMSGGTIYFPGGIQWDGQYMGATDQSYQGGHSSGVYKVSVSGSAATIVGSVELTDGACMQGSVSYNDTVQPFLNGTNKPFHAIVGGNLYCDNRYDFWNYIRGGDPKRNLPGAIAPLLAYGQTVSAMKR